MELASSSKGPATRPAQSRPFHCVGPSGEGELDFAPTFKHVPGEGPKHNHEYGPEPAVKRQGVVRRGSASTGRKVSQQVGEQMSMLGERPPKWSSSDLPTNRNEASALLLRRLRKCAAARAAVLLCATPSAACAIASRGATCIPSQVRSLARGRSIDARRLGNGNQDQSDARHIRCDWPGDASWPRSASSRVRLPAVVCGAAMSLVCPCSQVATRRTTWHRADDA